MPFTTVSTGAPSVFVASESALADAYSTLSTMPGGGTIYLTDDFSPDGQILLSGGGSNPVQITSANSNDPVEISRIAFDDVDNVRVSNVHIDSSEVSRPDFMRDIDITDSSRIEIADSTFSSNGSLFYDPSDPSAILGERLSMIRYCEDIAVTGNHISGYEQGLTFQESSQIRISDNEITAMQGDGIRLAGVENVLVSDNYMHDFSATSNEFTHSDFIQMWSRNAETMSSDVTITGNVLDTGNGVAVQAIWLGNTEYRGGNTSHLYNDITVTDNLIYSGAANGIGVEGANNVLVEGNTLLWNEEAVTIKADGDTSYAPRIRLQGVNNGEVNNNITTNIVSDGNVTLQGNFIISYDPSDPNYVGDHFVNVANGGDIGPEGWQLLPDSPLVGTGASASQPQPQIEPQVTGSQASPDAADLENGVVDLSGFDSAIPDGLEAPTVLLADDGGVFDSENGPIEIPHSADQATDEGTWSFTFIADNPGNGENQALMSKDHAGFGEGGHLTAYITGNGVLKVLFQDEQGEKYLYDSSTTIEAGEENHFAFTFEDNEIGLYLNGELVDADTGFVGGMSGNSEDLVLGASTRTRMGEDDNIEWRFEGEIGNVLLVDRALEEIELTFLSESGGDLSALDPLYDKGAEEEPEDEEDDTPVEQVNDDTPAEEDDDMPEDATEDEGFGAILSKIFDILLSVFGLGSSAPAPSENYEAELDEIEISLTELLPPRGMMNDELATEEIGDPEEEELLEAA